MSIEFSAETTEARKSETVFKAQILKKPVNQKSMCSENAFCK